LLNDAPCTDAGTTTAATETWRLPDDSPTPPPDSASVYNLQGAILVRDIRQPKGVDSLRDTPETHLELARRCFEDAQLRFRLASSYAPLRKAATERPRTRRYIDTQGRRWTLRSWQLQGEDFFLVSLGRETNDNSGHIVLATVVSGSRVDGATVLLEYVANFTLVAGT
jgi:hypothetical protein